MKKRNLYLTILCLSGMLFSCTTKQSKYNIVPTPQKIEAKYGYFYFKQGQKAEIITQNEEIKKIYSDFITQIKSVSGIELDTTSNNYSKSKIIFKQVSDTQKEGYRLSIQRNRLLVEASAPNGFFYAIQSIYQLLPVEFWGEENIKSAVKWRIACADITDEPRFAYRGMHLDVARYFMPKEYIFDFIDRLAAQKMNVFHFHITDDQGWRIEIKGYPKLIEVGATRPYTQTGFKTHHAPIIPDEKEHSGYYTQDDIREFVAYAAARYVTIIPEIELPGHASAAVAAYPELSCGTQKHYDVVKTFGIFDNVFCPNEKTFTFLSDVFKQVTDLFPSEYIHIGGDECPKTTWKICPYCQKLIKEKNLKDEQGLQSYFIHRVEEIVNGYGRKIIGWDEILDGGLAPNATVMSWRGEEGGIKAAKAGHNVVMIPHADTYLNYYQEDPEYAPIGSGSYLSLERVYKYDPKKNLSDTISQYILGTEAALWTVYMQNPEVVDYYMYPRFFAVAEVAWTKPNNKNYNEFLKHLKYQYQRLDKMKVKSACRCYFDVAINGQYQPERKQFEVVLESMYPNADVFYTTDGTEPTTKSIPYTKPIILSENTYIQTAVFENGKRVGKVTKKNFYIHKAIGKHTQSNVKYRYHPSNPGGKEYSEYNFSGLTNGIRGYVNHVHPWVAFRPSEYTEITIDMDTLTDVSSINYRVLNGYGAEAVAPEKATLELSKDSSIFVQIDEKQFTYRIENKWQIFEQSFQFETQKTRYIRIRLKNGRLPYNLGGVPVPKEREGELGLVFIDEIEVH